MTISGIRTVGELISALQHFSADAVIADGSGRGNFTVGPCDGDYPDYLDYVRIEA